MRRVILFLVLVCAAFLAGQRLALADEQRCNPVYYDIVFKYALDQIDLDEKKQLITRHDYEALELIQALCYHQRPSEALWKRYK